MSLLVRILLCCVICGVVHSTENSPRSLPQSSIKAGKTTVIKDEDMVDFLLTRQSDYGRKYYWNEQMNGDGVRATSPPDEDNRACSHYIELNSADRSEDFYDPDLRKCDSGLTPGWYRFTEPAGHGGMATKCPDKFKCGTYGTGWLKDPNPSVSEGIVSRRVCFHTEGECCHYSLQIQVKNCDGDFYVYKLQPPGGCPFRYCGAKAPDGCSSYKTLNTSDRSIHMYNPALSFCDSTLEASWYRFQGSAGSHMSEKCVPVFRCGTHSPSWLVGGHPSVLDGAVERRVCFHWFDHVNDIDRRRDNCCSFSKTISVINCGAFYVYRLTSTDRCYARYCSV